MEDQQTDRIITEVLRRLLPRLGANGSRGKIIAVLTGATVEMSQAATQLRALIVKGFELDIVFSAMAEHLYGPWLRDQLAGFPCWSVMPPVTWLKALRGARAVVAPLMSVNSLSRLALIIADNQTGNILLHGLMMGKPVIVGRDGFAPATADRTELGFNHGSAGLWQQIAEREQRIIRYGCTLVSIDELCAVTCTLLGEIAAEATTQGGEPCESEAPELLCRAAVVTAQDVQMACHNGHHLRVTQRAIVTPLARERAERFGVSIVRDGLA